MALIDTGLEVFDGERMNPVQLDRDGRFRATTADGSEIIKTTLADLRAYFEAVVKRLDAKRRDSGRKADPLPVTVMITGSPSQATDVLLRGIGVDGRRILASGLPAGRRLSDWDHIYRRFTGEEHAEYARLETAVLDAHTALRLFKDARDLGHAKDVAEKVECGIPVDGPVVKV